MKKYLSEEEITELFNISSITLQRWVHQGKIPYKLINNTFHYHKKDIMEWANEHGISILPNKNQDKNNSDICSLNNAVERAGVYYDVQGKDIYEVFDKYELEVDTIEIEQSLHRLELSYVLYQKNGEYRYRVPLFVEKTIKSSKNIDNLLKREIGELKRSIEY